MEISKFKSGFVKIILLFFITSCISNPQLQPKESEFDKNAYKIWEHKIETCIEEIETHLLEYTTYFNTLKQRLKYLEETYPLEQPFPYEFDLKTMENNIQKWKAYQQKLTSYLQKKKMHQAITVCKTSNLEQLQQELSLPDIKTLLGQKYIKIYQKRLALCYLEEGKNFFDKNSIFSAKVYFQEALKLDNELKEAHRELEKIAVEEEKQAKNQDLQVEVSYPERVFLGKRFRTTIQIKNSGRKTLNEVVVSANAEPQLTILSTEEGNISQNSITWKIGSLSAGQSKVYNVVMVFNSIVFNLPAILQKSRRNCLDITINAAEGIHKQIQSCTGCYCGIITLLEVIDTNDPLNVDEETIYIIEVTNQSTAPEFNIKIEAVFPVEISPIIASGDTEVSINGKKVSSASYIQLNPKEKIKWEIRAKARQPGDARIKVYMTSEMLKTPVVEEESTHVY